MTYLDGMRVKQLTGLSVAPHHVGEVKAGRDPSEMAVTTVRELPCLTSLSDNLLGAQEFLDSIELLEGDAYEQLVICGS